MKFSYRDQLNLLKKLNSHKLYNAYQIYRSYSQSQKSGFSRIKGQPFSISLEPTTACNLRCPECPSGLRSFTRPTGHLDESVFYRAIDQLYQHLIYLTFYFQGEPYLHPRFLDMVHYASSRGIYTATSTNAHYLDAEKSRDTVEAGLDRLIISIDGLDQDTYASYRVGGRLEKVIEGTREILSWRKKLKRKSPHVIFQFLVVGPNEHQIPQLYALAQELGVDEVKLKTAQIYDFENGSPLIPKNDRYSRYRKNEKGKFEIKNLLLNQCWKMWHSCVITWNGTVVPCCFDKDAQHTLGNIMEKDFSEIWFGEAYEAFRNRLLSSRKEIDICQNCTEGTKVWAE